MAVISFTKGDALRTQLVEASIQPLELIEIDGPKPSNSGKGVNSWLTFRIMNGKYEGKELKMCLSSSMDRGSILGGTQFEPQAKFLEIDAAVKKQPIKIEDKTLDTDNLLHKPLCGQVIVQTDEGKLVNAISAFLPAGAENGWEQSPF